MRTYHTLNLPLRSILKNSPSNNKLEKKSASYSDLQGHKEKEMRTYGTLNLSLRSKLENSPSNNKLEKKSASYSDLQGKRKKCEPITH